MTAWMTVSAAVRDRGAESGNVFKMKKGGLGDVIDL